jgi:FkbH-like protein
LETLKVPTRIDFAPFNQVFQELLSPTSSFAKNDKGVNIVLLRLEDLTGGSKETEALAENSKELCAALKTAAERLRVPTVLAFCPPSGAAQADTVFYELCNRIEAELTAELQSVKSLHIINSKQFTELCAVAEYDNPQGNKLGAVPYTERFYAILGCYLARVAYRFISLPHKVIVLDCDQTLWKGVCGEVGAQGIELDAPRRFLQEFMLAQYEAGMLLCLCSKNNEEDVWQVFAERAGDMPLKQEHIVSWRINWDAKSKNIKSLSNELQLGLDAFIFVDDDPVVCAEVEANCPEVLTICLPEDTNQINDFFCQHWAFDHLKVTTEDNKRTKMYRENAERNRLLENATSLEDFLKSLDLRCEITPMSAEHLPRVAQLTQRTNQFNATTIRRNESEIQHLLNGVGGKCLVVHVRDRFGDYGLVGALIYFVRQHELEVDSFLLSCRALGRGVEHQMLATLGELAVKAGKDSVAVNFVPTKKNLPAMDFLEKTGIAFKQANEEGTVVFRYPTEVARCLTYAPDTTQASNSETTAGKTTNQTVVSETQNLWQARGAGLRRIATELHKVESLLLQLKPVGTTRPELKTPYMPPNDEIEIQLTNLWQEILNVKPIGILDDFFELGGDSLLAVSLFVEIEKEFGKDLPIAKLFNAPTVRDLARFLNGAEKKEQWRYLVPIQKEGNQPPLFCMHAAGGNVLFYRDLSKHLGLNQPVYGLQAREAEQTGAFPNRVEEMATHYIKEIMEFQPEGPYYICGSSFGGLLAYEVAQQLKSKGKEVALLAMFDTYGPGYPQPLKNSNVISQKFFQIATRFNNLRGQLQQLDTKEKLGFIKQKANKIVTRFKRGLLWKKNEFQIKYSQATGRELPKDMQRNHKAIQQALETYIPQPYQGKLTLFRASIQPKGIVPDPILGWGELPSEGIDVHEAPGIHGAMTVDPYAKSLAEQLVCCLMQKQKRER